MKFLTRFLILLIVLGMFYLCMKIVMTTPRQRVMAGQTALYSLSAGSKEKPRRTSITLDSFLHVQQLRRKQLRNFCKKFPQFGNVSTSDSAEHLLSSMTLSHKLMTLYCKPEDVTIDGWEELVQSLERRSDVTIRNPLPVDDSASIDTLAKYNPTMFAQVLRTYTKILFVGDPYERLISLYMQGNAGEVTFEEFIEDILLMELGEGGISSSSVITLCFPCFVQYDYIVLLDFLRVELPHLLKRMGLPESVGVPPSVDHEGKATSRWLLENLFRGLSKEQFKQISQLYSWDFAAFPFHNSLIGNRTVGRNVLRW
ncbi:carbohydrate sulfotransferase 11-like [Dendropsophus ebraccatus]|uniref:carbohydrate sulfotransferase 11-like n=1 Tax=Dendropsophus ebraccatus TaxID=150705 RepID=UPI0038315FFC